MPGIRIHLNPLCAGLALLAASAAADDYPAFNARIGTQTFGPLYGFTADTRLVETAEAIHDMGSDIVKIDLSWKAFDSYDLPATPGVTSLTTLASTEPSVRHVFDMPFRYYLAWAYPMAVSVNWHDGLNGTEATGEYTEIYDLARHFLQTYSGSGKTLLIGHWEGDWHLLNGFDPGQTPAPLAIAGMTDWLRVRQKAVSDARASIPHTNVFIYHYAEVNLLRKAVTGGVTVVNNVLPFLTNDLISYSSYDTQADLPALTNALAYILSKAHTTSNFHKDAFIGEYGFFLTNESQAARTPQQQADLSEGVMKAAAGWGCPFTLYWQMYDNETNSSGSYRGFWLINNLNQKQPSYYLHQDFLGRVHTLKNIYRFWLGRNPDDGALDNFCAYFDTITASNLVNQLITSGEYATHLPDPQFLFFLFDALYGCTSPYDSDYQACLAMLGSGTNRRAMLDRLLDGPRFSNACPDSVFAEMLLGGTLRIARVAPTNSAVVQTAARLAAGTPRSSLWREFLNSNAFYLAELDLRQDDEIGSPSVFTKYFFDYDRDKDGMADAWERQIINASGSDAITCIEDVAAASDYDGDGLSNGNESRAGSDPVAKDTDGDGLWDGQEIPGTQAFIDPLDSITNLDALVNTRIEKNGSGEVAFLRTNSTPGWSEAIVDWQRGGAAGSFLSVTGTPIARIAPVSSVRTGEWTVAVEFFDASGTYLDAREWVPGGQRTTLARTNVADLASQGGIAGAAQYRLRFRIGPADNGGREPGFLFTEIAALPDGSTDPLDQDSDDDGQDDGQEYVAGTNPNDATEYFRVEPDMTLGPGGQVISWQSRTGRLYRVKAAADITNTWETVHTVSGTGLQQRYTNDLGNQAREFLRVDGTRQ